MKRLDELWPRLLGAVRRFREHPRDSWRPATRATVLALEVLASCIRKLRRDRAAEMAAALAFQTLFSLLPLLVLALIVLHSVRGLQDAETHLRNLIVEFLVPDSLVQMEVGLIGPPAPGPATVEDFADARLVLRRRLDGVIDQLSQVSFAGIGAAGFLLFVYGATTLMRTIESSFNLLCQANAARPWTRLPMYFTLIMLGPVALVSAQVMQSRMLLLLGSWLGGWVAAPLSWVAPLVVTCALLAIAFRVVPNAWLSWHAAAIGGLWSGVAWFAFQEIFGFYVSRASVTSLYGALALLPLFLLWIYWSWLIILAGVALAFIAQYLDADENWVREQSLPGDPRWLLPIVARIGAAFAGGTKMTAVRLCHELRLPPRILRPYLQLLERGGYVHRAGERGADPVFMLSKPLRAIKAREVLELAPPARAAAAGELLRELRRRELELAGELTLEDLVSVADPAEPVAGLATPPGPVTEPAGGRVTEPATES